MSEMSAGKQDSQDAPKLNKKQVRAYIADIESKVAADQGADMASLIALNHLLTMPNAEKVLDEDLRRQLKDLWQRLKAKGVQLDDPPLLFGLPEGFGEEEAEEEEELTGTPVSDQPAPVRQAPEPDGSPEKPDGTKEGDIEIPEEDQELPH